MTWLVAATASELSNGAMKAVDLEGHEILVARIDGNYHAVSRRCTHMAENLCQGTLDGRIVTCPRHGARFDVTSGKAVGKAKLLFLATTPKALPTYAVKVEGDEVLIEIA